MGITTPIGIDQTTNTTDAVAELWSEVLQTEQRPNATDNFFSLGGDSMSMVILEFRINEEFGVKLPAGSVLVAPTPNELSVLVDAAREGLSAPHNG